jgi:multiple sugar transport system substrate-binding protein
MQWGAPAYNVKAAALVKSYNATHPHNPPVTYQSTSWTDYYEKFAAAIASHTNPACSSGAGYQAFQFYDAGAIQPLDELVARFKTDGIAKDFYPGLLEAMRYKGHYVAIPWQLDIRVAYFRKSVLAKVGAAPPATWDDMLTLGAALKKKGYYLLATAGNPSFTGWQFLPAPFMIGNGGGFFNAKGEPDALQPANVEAVEFMLKLAKDGYLNPESVEFDQASFQSLFGSGKAALTFQSPEPTVFYSPSVNADIGVMSPIKSTTGKTGTLYWVNNLMAYTGVSYDLNGMYEWYTAYESLMKAYWQQELIQALPVRKSFGSIPQVADNPTLSNPLKEWLPVAKTTAAQGQSLSPGLNALEGSTALPIFTQEIIRGQQSATSILKALQPALESAMK